MATALAAFVPAAPGRTLGSAAWPLDATEFSCLVTPGLVGFQATERVASWTVPDGGVLTSWSTNVIDADPGTSVSIVVLRTVGADLRIVAVDRAALPLQPPAGGVAAFRPATRITLEAGDRLGFSGAFGATCGWQTGAIPTDQRATVWQAAPEVRPGASLTEYYTPQPATQVNLAAEVLEATDLRVTAAAGPANVVVGALAQLSATVSNAGPVATPVTVTDAVPAGLTVQAAVAGGGSCTVAGQLVTCEIPSLAPGASVPVVVLVTPTAPGGYVNRAAAEPALESAPGDNSASATLTAVAPPDGGRRAVERVVVPAPPRCVVPTLTRTPLGVARGLLRQLDCRVGTVTRKRSAKVPKGAVISTAPGRGLYRAGSSVRVVVSSGKPARKPARKGRGRR
ncbi:MAG TPA: PASTA domain-containing protein [Conexibacter sp.]|nr:PASTA domain-containing protein [Conexibacter sp.]